MTLTIALALLNVGFLAGCMWAVHFNRADREAESRDDETP